MEGRPSLPEYVTDAERAKWKAAVTDQNGEYRMLYSGEELMSVESLESGLVTEQNPPHLCWFPSRAGKTTFTVRVGPPCSLSGRVFDTETESGIAGVVITLDEISGDCEYDAVTDANGQYQFKRLLPGRYYVKRSATDGFDDAPKFRGLHFLEAKIGFKIADADFPLARTSNGSISSHQRTRLESLAPPTPSVSPRTVRGRLFDSDGEPVEKARVFFLANRPAVVTDAGGRFTINELPAGTYPLEIRHGNHAFRGYRLETGARRVALVLKDPEPLALTPQRVPTMDGGARYPFSVFVVDARTQIPIQHYVCGSTPLSDWFTRQDLFGGGHNVFTADGMHTVSNAVWYSPYRVSVAARGYATSSQVHTISLEPQRFSGPNLFFKMYQEAVVNGRVLAPDGSAVSGARIVADARPGPEWFPPFRSQRSIAVTSPDGTFAVNDLPLIPVTLTAFDDQWGRSTMQVTPVSGAATNVEFRFIPTGLLDIDVLCGDATQSDARVYLTFDDKRAQTETGGEYKTDLTGSVYLPHVIPSQGIARVVLRPPNAPFERVRAFPLIVSENEFANLLCVFAPGCAALIIRIDCPDDELLNANLSLRYPKTGDALMTDSQKGGEVILNNLPAGRATATFTIRTSSGLYIRTLPLNLKAGSLGQAVVSLPGYALRGQKD